jgi:hypothetical protein
MKARRDDRILCENGHVGGLFLRDVPDNRPVQTDDLSIAGQLMTVGTGYECSECHAPIARQIAPDRWEVRTLTGWIR